METTVLHRGKEYKVPGSLMDVPGCMHALLRTHAQQQQQQQQHGAWRRLVRHLRHGDMVFPTDSTLGRDVVRPMPDLRDELDWFQSAKLTTMMGYEPTGKTREGCMVERLPEGGVRVTTTCLVNGRHEISNILRLSEEFGFVEGSVNTFMGRWRDMNEQDAHVYLCAAVLRALDVPWDVVENAA